MKEMLKEMSISLLNSFGLAHWVKIISENPQCTYYFGPFLTSNEAHAAQAGYVEDLIGEGAKVDKLEVRRCKPQHLTVYDESNETTDLKLSMFSSQTY
ncbi:DUF1816 domain-containing protein [Myxosarcina sp. GI1(2024)]